MDAQQARAWLSEPRYKRFLDAAGGRHGYVEPTEAAWMLLERAVEPWIDDIARRAALGLQEGREGSRWGR